jgi:hypothetical protein
MSRQENETYQEYLEGASRDKDGVHRTRDGRVFETAMTFPDKLTVEEFIEEVTNPKRTKAFIANMNNLTNEMPDKMLKHQHAEEWIQTFAAWSEMN